MGSTSLHMPLWLDDDSRILLAVSGGVDSMVMFDMFWRSVDVSRFAVAHCNFSLRGDDSVADMELVERVCQERGVKFHEIIFDTHSQMQQRGLSLQQCARELRYDWFEHLCDEYGYGAVATAHNSNDTIETFFINCARGTGVRGLTGIPSVNGRIIRPVLGIDRPAIAQYAVDMKVEYRDDKSNATTKYLRNAIRHDIIPLFEQKKNNFREVMLDNIDRISQSVEFLEWALENQYNRCVSVRNNKTMVDIAAVCQISCSEYLLYEIVSRWGFTRTQSDSILECYKSGFSGRKFLSDKCEGYVSRNFLEVYGNKELLESVMFCRDSKRVEYGNFIIDLSVETYDFARPLDRGTMSAVLDYDKLLGDMQVGAWQESEYIYPLGMRGKKLLSDLFIDKKISLNDKSSMPVLRCGGDVVWVVSLRIDRRFAVDATTQKVLICDAHIK